MVAYNETRITPRAVKAPTPVAAGVAMPAISSGFRENQPAIRIRITGTDDGPIDTMAGQYLSDVLDFWDTTPLPQGKGFFLPPHLAASYDSSSGKGVTACLPEMIANAAACKRNDGRTSIEWDRGVLLPGLLAEGNSFSIGLVLAHETGHLVDYQLNDTQSPGSRNLLQTMINEQRADCFSGSWMAYVAAGDSRRFTVTPEDAAEAVGSVLAFRDLAPNRGHGTGIERVHSLLQGFTNGPDFCAQIDSLRIRDNGAGIPSHGRSTDPSRYRPITEFDVQAIRAAVGSLTGTDPKLTSTPCPEAPAEGVPASWCASRKEVSADLEAFAEVAPRKPHTVVPLGPGHKLGPLLSALVQPYLTEGGRTSTSAETACAVGVVARALTYTKSGELMDFGDLDEITDELFRVGNSATASDGKSDELALSRVKHFTDGVYSVKSVEDCLGRF